MPPVSLTNPKCVYTHAGISTNAHSTCAVITTNSAGLDLTAYS